MLCMLLLAAAVSDAPAPVDPTAPPTPRPACLNCDYDTPPKVLRMPRPVYPTIAAVDRVEGMVVVEMMISETGEPTRVRVVESIPGLDEAAVDNARQWSFKPALKDGKPVPSLVYGEVKFRLLDGPKTDDAVLSRSFIVAPVQTDEDVPTLLKRLRHRKLEVRAEAAWKLSAVANPGPEALAALLAALDDSSSTVRDRAALALFAMNDPAAQATLAVDSVPPFTSRREPRFPEGVDKTVEGHVALRLLVSETGRVIQARYEHQATPELDRLAVATTSHWRYEPRMKDGRPRPFVTKAALHFEKGRAHLGDSPAISAPAGPSSSPSSPAP